ncbi:MAG: hypothetical protein JWO11_2691 [Nocardioides sp.]|nr:hypothetical protein [Nocardioides sp.]
MTDQTTSPMSTSDTAAPMGEPSVFRVLRDQRKTILVATALVVASYWVAGQLGEWRLAGCIAGGILLGLLNHLYTEYWLLKIICSGAEPSRNQMVVATVVRLLILAVVAVSIAVVFWPDGIGLLLGLALFRLIALVMTGLPLLKELKKQ